MFIRHLKKKRLNEWNFSNAYERVGVKNQNITKWWKTQKIIGVKKMLDRTIFECRISLFVYCLPVLLFSVSIDIVIPRNKWKHFRNPSPKNSLVAKKNWLAQWALCSWGHVATIFLKIFYIMGYNLKNARNGKSMSKTSKRQSFKLLALKNEILWRFQF